VGGRLAMLLLRLTSDPVLRGVSTDDGFTIGRFSAQTIFLLPNMIAKIPNMGWIDAYFGYTRMDQFVGIPNVLLTPHISGVTLEATHRVSFMTVDSVVRVLKKAR
jgi:hypothetical protein